MKKKVAKPKTSAAGRRSLGQENIRSLTKTSSGTSYAITLPMAMVKKLKWKERQKLMVTMKGATLTIKDWPIRPAQGRKK